MKLFVCLIALALIFPVANAQMVAKVVFKKPIKGLCNAKEVYSLFPMFGDQLEAFCPLSDDDIVNRLDSLVVFLQDNPKYSGKGMVSIMINCKGEMVNCEIDNKTKEADLDRQVVAVFSTLGKWEPGLLNGKPVDSMQLYSFTIKEGKISIE